MINIKNIKKIESASITLADRITIIDGKNKAGKSTILKALMALFTNDINAGLTTAKAKKDLLKTGTKTGSIEGNGLTYDYPSMKVTGDPETIIDIHSSEIRDTVLEKKSTELQSFFINLLKSEPNYKEFYDACNFIEDEIEVWDEEKNTYVWIENRGKTLKPLWKRITTLGWDKVHKQILDYRKSCGQDWGKLTGEKFGIVKAEEWAHENYTLDLESRESNFKYDENVPEIKTFSDLLDARVDDTKFIYETSIAVNAINEDEIEKLEVTVAGKEKNKKAIDAAVKDIEGLEKNLQDEINSLDALEKEIIPAKDESNLLKCPCCDKKLEMIQGKLVEFKTPTAAELVKIKTSNDEIQEKIFVCEENISTIKTDINEMKFERSKMINKRTEIEGAEKKLEEFNQTKKSDVEDPEHCLEIYNNAQNELHAYTVTMQAKKYYNDYVLYDSLGEVIGPKGIRNTKVAGAVKTFNDVADKYFTKWSYRAHRDFSVIDENGYGYKDDYSSAEQWMSRVVYQVCSAIIRKDKMIFIDTIEHLDRSTFKEFISQVYPTGLKIVVAWAAAEETEIMEIEKFPGCKRYTINNGVVK